MGLSDFFKKGKEEPAKGAKAPGQQGGFFGAGDKQQVTETPTPAPAPAATSQDVYTVQSGDSLSKIAKNHYGNAADWKKIYEANKATIGNNPDLIKPGQRLTIPR